MKQTTMSAFIRSKLLKLRKSYDDETKSILNAYIYENIRAAGFSFTNIYGGELFDCRNKLQFPLMFKSILVKIQLDD